MLVFQYYGGLKIRYPPGIRVKKLCMILQDNHPMIESHVIVISIRYRLEINTLQRLFPPSKNRLAKLTQCSM